MHHTIGILALAAAIAFAFGERTARVVVGLALIAGALLVLYVFYRVATGSV